MRKKSDLHAFQQRAIDRMYSEKYGQAVIPMGGGKTVTALTTHRELIDDKEIRCALVVAPKRVAASVWPNEPAEWEHLQDHTVVAIIGTPAQRMTALEQDADTYVIGIENFPWLAEVIRDYPADHKIFDRLDIDEISRFRNPRSERVKKFVDLLPRFKQIWGLTGSPAASSLMNQYMPLQIISCGAIWPEKFDDWKNRYFMATDYMCFNWVIRPEWIGKITRDVDAVSFTVAENDLPHKPDLHIPAVHWVDLPPKAMAIYKKMEKDLLVEFGEDMVVAQNAGVMTGKLEQIIQGFIYDEGELVEVIHDEKIKMLADLVEGAGGEPLLIAYHFKEDLAAIQRQFPGISNLGAGVSDKQAKDMIAEWNANKLLAMAIHPASAGHGVNLQHGQARQLVWYTPTWDPELYDQLSARIARQGNNNDHVFVHPILARDTIDEIKWDRVANKLSAQEAFIKYLNKV